MPKKVITWSLIALVVFFVAFNPGSAMSFVKSLGETAVDIFLGVADFFSSLVNW